MFILDATTKTLEIVLSGAITTTQLPFTTSYVDVATSTQAVTPGAQDGATNSTTAVTIMAAPASGSERRLAAFSVTNSDTAPATVTLRLNDNATLRNIYKAVFAVGDNLVISQQKLTLYDLNGSVKSTVSLATVTQGGTGLATLTAHAVMLGEGVAAVGFATIGTSGRMLIDQGAGADPSFNVMSGDATITNAGALTVQKIQTNVVSGTTGTGNVVFSASPTLTGTATVAAQTNSGLLYLNGGTAEEAVFANGNSGTSKAINLDNGNLQSITITGAVAITQITPTHPGKYTLIVTQDGTGHVYSLSSIKWASGTAPLFSTAANKVDIMSIIYDGTNYYGQGSVAFS